MVTQKNQGTTYLMYGAQKIYTLLPYLAVLHYNIDSTTVYHVTHQYCACTTCHTHYAPCVYITVYRNTHKEIQCMPYLVTPDVLNTISAQSCHIPISDTLAYIHNIPILMFKCTSEHMHRHIIVCTSCICTSFPFY